MATKQIKKLSDLQKITTATGDQMIPVVDASGNVNPIKLTDLAQVVAGLIGFLKIAPTSLYNGKGSAYFELLNIPGMSSASYEVSLQHVTNGVNVSVIYADRHSSNDNELMSYKKDLVGKIKFFTDKVQNKIYIEVLQYYTVSIRPLVGTNKENFITIAQENKITDVTGLNEITSTIS